MTIERVFSISLALNAILASTLGIVILHWWDKRKKTKEEENKFKE